MVVVGELLEQDGDNGKNKKTFLDEFIQDFLGIVTSFAGKFYRMRKDWMVKPLPQIA